MADQKWVLAGGNPGDEWVHYASAIAGTTMVEEPEANSPSKIRVHSKDGEVVVVGRFTPRVGFTGLMVPAQK